MIKTQAERLRWELKVHIELRNKPIVKSFDGGFVYPREEIRRLIRHIRSLES